MWFQVNMRRPLTSQLWIIIFICFPRSLLSLPFSNATEPSLATSLADHTNTSESTRATSAGRESVFDPWLTFEQQYDDDADRVSLNYSQFNFGHKIMRRGVHIPRILLEMFADENIALPDNVALVRSFPVTFSESLDTTKPFSDWSKNDARNIIANQSFVFGFNVTFVKSENVHSAIFRIFTRAKRKTFELVGVARRIRILAVDSVPDNCSVVEHDVYLHKNSWTSIDVSPIVTHWRNNPQTQHSFQVEISASFSSVGGQGTLDIISDLSSQLRPHLLLYTNEKDTSRHRRSLMPVELEEEESNSIWEGSAFLYSNIPQQANIGKKLGRKARQRRAEKSCKRKPLSVSFKEIGWDSWVYAPPSYEAFQCSGKCFYPLPSHLTPTMHAIIQNLVHSVKPDEAPRACCVPTRLGSTSLLYLQNNVLTYNKKYKGMVVEDCGCR